MHPHFTFPTTSLAVVVVLSAVVGSGALGPAPVSAAGPTGDGGEPIDVEPVEPEPVPTPEPTPTSEPTPPPAPPTTSVPTTTVPTPPSVRPTTSVPATSVPATTSDPTPTPTTVPNSTTIPTAPVETTPTLPGPTQPSVPPVLRPATYDGVFADGVAVGVAMATTRWLESRSDYSARAQDSTASGAYQVTDSVWDGFAGYARAVDAPPDVQDRFAYESLRRILQEHDGNVWVLPLVWYYGSVPPEAEMDVIAAGSTGNLLTPREYQTTWMATFVELLQQGAPPVLPPDTDPLVPSLAFPVLGPITYSDSWHHPRDGGARKHEGTDLIAERGQPLRAAFDGEVVRLVRESGGISGVSIEIRRDDGDLEREPLSAVYRHVNDDTFGTNDGRAAASLRIHPDIEVGTTVRAGQIIGYNGNSGKIGYVPHLHFELRLGEERTPFNPYPALLEAEQREKCSIGIGPWSTTFESPATTNERLDELTVEEVEAMSAVELAELTEEQRAGLDGITDEQLAGLADYEPPWPFLIEGPDGARWTIAADGTVRASGAGALVAPNRGQCDEPDGETWYGTGAAGLPAEHLSPQWWGDQVEVVDGSTVTDTVPTEHDAPRSRFGLGSTLMSRLAGLVDAARETDG